MKKKKKTQMQHPFSNFFMEAFHFLIFYWNITEVSLASVIIYSFTSEYLTFHELKML